MGRLALPGGSAQHFPVAGRRVDGTKIRELLDVELKYASYKPVFPPVCRRSIAASDQNARPAAGVITLTEPRSESSASTSPDTSTFPMPSA